MADDQVREATVEAVARELWDEFGDPSSAYDDDDWWRARARTFLSLPAVSALLVKARADGWDEGHGVGWDDCARLVYDDIDAETPNPHRAAIRQTEGNNR